MWPAGNTGTAKAIRLRRGQGYAPTAGIATLFNIVLSFTLAW
ncbi:MAG: hypothetical protein QF405_02770 [Roseibacillus sp.]|nr:hypothetical protein [Roseibacillus sp.]MDP7306537.1 hypothetical protein [Roseibacillus sp.]